MELICGPESGPEQMNSALSGGFVQQGQRRQPSSPAFLLFFKRNINCFPSCPVKNFQSCASEISPGYFFNGAGEHPPESDNDPIAGILVGGGTP
ncbi:MULTISPECIES: hypothetical protein [unclassified Akkermansia]|uniref:hypothetical protein n=1 Tax=unclassified Akkermansia TaxID=2608915 RepID=UPI00079A443B|nr:MULTISPECIES: hypothetical protein [unclassified Akkermansia]KXT50924.1 hypothetical protein HMPREF3038_01521 [Akkermansia sp. KLE1797]KXU54009.1 hypothetical protein HMPREF3039_01674 [Akkermansia sp. KLE1798]